MKRKVLTDLLSWKNSSFRKPLIVQGARQTGKTYSICDFGKSHYKNLAYVNLETSEQAAKVFDGDINPERIVNLLSSITGEQIKPQQTLLFIDEAQAHERALTSLKYFHEDAPEYHVVAAGSLLGLAVSRKRISYPVGKADMLTMYPMDFEEFCWALNQKMLSDTVRECCETSERFPLHSLGMELYRQYLVVGGMPEAVAHYATNKDYTGLNKIQNNIMDSYIADITKYADASDTVRILETYRSLTRQLLKENRKFQYSVIQQGARASKFMYPLAWLEVAHLTLPCHEVTEGRVPLMYYKNPDSFKVYMSDVGLLNARFDVNPADIVQDNIASTLYKGALAENYVMQQLITQGYKPLYWGKPRYAEVDFVITNAAGNVVPIEVKSGENVRSKSLTIFKEKYKCPYAIRFSAKNIGFENNIKSLPLYTTFCLEALT